MREIWGGGEESHASICTGFREALMICEGKLGGEGSHASVCTGFREALMICEGKLGGRGVMQVYVLVLGRHS